MYTFTEAGQLQSLTVGYKCPSACLDKIVLQSHDKHVTSSRRCAKKRSSKYVIINLGAAVDVNTNAERHLYPLQLQEKCGVVKGIYWSICWTDICLFHCAVTIVCDCVVDTHMGSSVAVISSSSSMACLCHCGLASTGSVSRKDEIQADA